MTSSGAQINLAWLGLRIILALILSLGWVEADPSEAEKDFALGQQYQKGQGVPQDYAQAMSWYQKAAAQGDVRAQYNIGVLYTSGQGVPQDDVQAMSWFKKAADHGNANAQYSMGVLYEMNRGIPQDHSQAMNWFQKAAAQGNANAEYNVGYLYDLGEGGVPQDYAQAMIWYQKAAAQGVGDAQSNAQNNIGALYEYGRGVPVDVKKAVEWYKKAAANNNDKAKSNLARLGSASLVRPGSGFSFISAFFVFVVVWVLRRMFYPGINTTEIFLENVIEIAPGVQGGDIRISVYGKSTYVTQGQKSNFPQMSKKLFGWCQWMGENGHVLEIRSTKNPSIAFKTFQPARILPDQQVIITNWGFTDKGKCVVIASTVVGQGYDCFIKYEIETAQVLGQVAEKTAFADLPQWALWQLNPS